MGGCLTSPLAKNAITLEPLEIQPRSSVILIYYLFIIYLSNYSFIYLFNYLSYLICYLSSKNDLKSIHGVTHNPETSLFQEICQL